MSHLCKRRSEIPGIANGVFRVPQEDNYDSDNTCTWCGSLNEDEFMKLIEEGELEISPTDKSYKVYVYSKKTTALEFYFQHLKEEQMKRFVELYNQKKIKFRGDNGFYVMPFFMKAEKF